MKVKIVNCGSRMYWYEHLIGDEYDVEVCDVENYQVKNVPECLLRKVDVVIVEESATKPPLGIVPADIFYKQRMKDLLKTMDRYVDADIPIPDKWITEFCGLRNFVEEL